MVELFRTLRQTRGVLRVCLSYLYRVYKSLTYRRRPAVRMMTSSVLPSISNTSMPDDYVAPDRPSRCTWSVDKSASDANPHRSISKFVACVSPSCSQQSRDLLVCLRGCFSSFAQRDRLIHVHPAQCSGGSWPHSHDTTGQDCQERRTGMRTL